MSVVAVVCRFASLGKALFVAAVFGAGTVVDAYALAILVPWAAMALYANGLRRAFQTRYGEHELRGTGAAERFANRYVFVAMSASVGMAGAGIGLFPLVWPTLAGGRADVLAILRSLTWPTATTLVPMTAAVTLTALLNVRGRFSGPQWAVVCGPVCIVVALLLVPEPTAATLMWGSCVGFGVQAGVLAVMLLVDGHRFGLGRDPKAGPVVRTLWIVGLSTIALDVMDFVNTLVDRAMAASLPEGSVAVLHWSALVKDSFTGTLVMSMLTVFVPEFGRRVAAGEFDELRRVCTRLLRTAAVCVLPVSALIVVAAPPLLAMLRIGALEATSSAAIGLCLAGYAFALFGTLVGPLFLQVLVAQHRLGTVAVIGLLASFVPNVVLNLLLIGPLGAVGLAISTSVAASLGSLAAYLVLRHSLGIDDERTTLTIVAAAVLVSAFATVAGWIVVAALGSNGLLAAVTGVVTTTVICGVGVWLTPARSVLIETFAMLRRR